VVTHLAPMAPSLMHPASIRAHPSCFISLFYFKTPLQTSASSSCYKHTKESRTICLNNLPPQQHLTLSLSLLNPALVETPIYGIVYPSQHAAKSLQPNLGRCPSACTFNCGHHLALFHHHGRSRHCIWQADGPCSS